LPSWMQNRQACQGQVTMPPSRYPPASEAPMCGQKSSIAENSPSSLNTATIRPLTAKARPSPAGISLNLATATKSVMSRTGRLHYDRWEVAEFYTGSRLVIEQASAMGWRLKSVVLLTWLACTVALADAEENTAQTLLLKGRYAEAAQWFSRNIT